MLEFRKIPGFGIIELLITLVIITVLTVTITKVMRSQFDEFSLESKGKIRAVFNKLLEKEEGIRIINAGRDSLDFKSGNSEGSIKLAGDAPYGILEVFNGNENLKVADNVYSLNFTYYDKNSNLIFDDDAYSNPSNIYRVKVSIYKHSGTEDSSLLISDGIHGIDLDGDPSNGTAKLSKIEFLVDLNRL